MFGNCDIQAGKRFEERSDAVRIGLPAPDGCGTAGPVADNVLGQRRRYQSRVGVGPESLEPLDGPSPRTRRCALLGHGSSFHDFGIIVASQSRVVDYLRGKGGHYRQGMDLGQPARSYVLGSVGYRSCA
jgi:hypothetical protein